MEVPSPLTLPARRGLQEREGGREVRREGEEEGERERPEGDIARKSACILAEWVVDVLRQSACGEGIPTVYQTTSGKPCHERYTKFTVNQPMLSDSCS